MTLTLSPSLTASARGLGPAAWLALAVAVVLAAATLFDPRFLGDGDTYWHLGAGLWMLDNLAVPHTDPFSHTRPGVPWTAHEWLSEVLMAAAYRLGGWAGLLVLFAGAVASTAVLLTGRLSRHLTGPTLIAAVVLAFGLAAQSLLARPHVLVLPVLLGWALVLLRARDAGRAPALPWAMLMVLWANLHGSYVFGFVLLAPFALEVLLDSKPQERWRVIRDWGTFGVLSLLGALITPHGPEGLIYPFYIMTLKATGEIKEWLPPDLSELTPLTVAVFVGLFACLKDGVRLPTIRLGLLLLLLFMTLQHARHMLVLGVVAPLLLAPALGSVAARQPAPARFDRRFVVLLATAFVGLALSRLSIPLERSDDRATPATALAAVPADLAARPVLNDYTYGGYLIFRELKPFIDGRADMYGDAFFFDYQRAVAGDRPTLDRLIEDHRIAWTLFPVGHAMVGTLDRRSGWRRLHTDAQAVVHVRASFLDETTPVGK